MSINYVVMKLIRLTIILASGEQKPTFLLPSTAGRPVVADKVTFKSSESTLSFFEFYKLGVRMASSGIADHGDSFQETSFSEDTS